MLKDNSIYLAHILNRAEKIIQYIQGIDEALFLNDDKTQSAIIRELEVIGEATKKISEEFKNKHSNIPWKAMAGMRDMLIHNYEGVSAYRVWDTVNKDIPALIAELKMIV